MEHWKTFLAQYQKGVPIKKAIIRDVWNMFFEFVALTARDSEALSKIGDEGICLWSDDRRLAADY